MAWTWQTSVFEDFEGQLLVLVSSSPWNNLFWTSLVLASWPYIARGWCLPQVPHVPSCHVPLCDLRKDGSGPRNNLLGYWRFAECFRSLPVPIRSLNDADLRLWFASKALWVARSWEPLIRRWDLQCSRDSSRCCWCQLMSTHDNLCQLMTTYDNLWHFFDFKSFWQMEVKELGGTSLCSTRPRVHSSCNRCYWSQGAVGQNGQKKVYSGQLVAMLKTGVTYLNRVRNQAIEGDYSTKVPQKLQLPSFLSKEVTQWFTQWSQCQNSGRLASLPRLVLISEHLEAKKSWNSLDATWTGADIGPRSSERDFTLNLWWSFVI